jgi:4-coumarate--CoA ligase
MGTIVLSTEVKIVDPAAKRECGVNEPGEIWAMAPQVVMGYLNDEKATDDAFDTDGVLHMEDDVSVIDADGLISEMIKAINAWGSRLPKSLAIPSLKTLVQDIC